MCVRHGVAGGRGSLGAILARDAEFEARVRADIRRWWVPGDFDGLIGQALGGVIQLMLVLQTLGPRCGFSDERVTKVLLPAAGSAIRNDR